MKKILMLIFITQLSKAQITFDSTAYWETAMWDSIAKIIAKADKEQHTYYYTLTGVNIPKAFNVPMIEMCYNKRRKIFIQKAD